MSRRLLRTCLLVAAVALVAAAGRGEEAKPERPANCAADPDLLRPFVRLERVAAARAGGTPLRLLVLGTGSSQGLGVSDPAAAYPHRLQAELSRLLPQVATGLENASERGLTAADMAQRLPDLLRRHRPTLLIWQTGTVDAIRAIDLNAFAAALERGIDAADAAGADLLLIDAQYGSTAFELSNVAAYRSYMEQIVRGREVLLFRRYEIMRGWADEGWLETGGLPPERQKALADRVHECIGRLLARMIVEAAS